jgi:hypothetical protein
MAFGVRETRSEENENTQHFCGSLKKRDSLEDLAVDRRATFKIILKKHIVRRRLKPCGSGKREPQASLHTVMNFRFTLNERKNLRLLVPIKRSVFWI